MSAGYLEVVKPGPLTTVQDLGRAILGAYGIAEGGALDRGAHRRANRLVGNRPGAASLEFTLGGPRLRWHGRGRLAVACVGDGETATALRPGELFDAGSLGRRARGYLAVAGGIDVPLVLGSRATALLGSFGGLDGRALRAGDRLAVLRPRVAPHMTAPADALTTAAGRLRVMRGPHGGAGSFRAFCDATWRVTAGDRVGVNLEGPELQLRPLGLSCPMAPGCVQVTGAGQPIVLLRDHPTVGGYPVIAIVIQADLDRLAQLRPGAELRIRACAEPEAIAALGARP